jgi:hypothetical protein
MWGQNWGQMNWGNLALAVPAAGFWGALLLATLLGGLGIRRLRGARPRLLGIVALALALLVPISARALPYTFTNGTAADATQVNANFAALAAQQGLAPTASSNLVELQTTGSSSCAGYSGIYALTVPIGADGVKGNNFRIPNGQTLVLSSLDATITGGTSLAGHQVLVTVYRQGATVLTAIAYKYITLASGPIGGTNISFSFPTGSPFASGTAVCFSFQDAVTSGFLDPGSVFARGFLTSQ